MKNKHCVEKCVFDGTRTIHHCPSGCCDELISFCKLLKKDIQYNRLKNSIRMCTKDQYIDGIKNKINGYIDSLSDQITELQSKIDKLEESKDEIKLYLNKKIKDW